MARQDGTISARLSPHSSIKVHAALRELLGRVKNLAPVNAEIAKYLVSDTRRRISSTKTAPDGTPWAPMSPVTEDLRARITALSDKHHDLMSFRNKVLQDAYLPGNTLFNTGALYRSVRVGKVGPRQIEVEAGGASAPYAGAMQDGVRTTGGFIPGKSVPARPFLGFSEANLRTIARKIRAFIEKGER